MNSNKKNATQQAAALILPIFIIYLEFLFFDLAFTNESKNRELFIKSFFFPYFKIQQREEMYWNEKLVQTKRIINNNKQTLLNWIEIQTTTTTKTKLNTHF